MLLSAVCSAPVNAASAIPQPASMTLDGHSCLCCGSKVTQGAVVVCWGAAFVSGGPKKGSLMCLWQFDNNIANSPGMAAAIFSLRLSTSVHSPILLTLPQKRKQQISMLLFFCTLFHGNSLSSLHCFSFPVMSLNSKPSQHSQLE